MQVTVSAKPSKHFGVLLDDETLSRNLLRGITKYEEPPLSDISLQEFEDFALKRVNVLKFIHDKAGPDGRVQFDDTGGGYYGEIEKCLRDNDLDIAYGESESALEKIHTADKISHFINRVAFCVDREKQDWFVKNEATLMEFRLTQLLKNSSGGLRDEMREESLKKLGVDYPLVPPNECVDVEDLTSTNKDVDKRIFYRVPFEQATYLVRSRRCVVRGGDAFVPQTELARITLAKFRRWLSNSMESMGKGILEEFRRDSKIGLVLRSLPIFNTGLEFTEEDKSPEERVTLHNIDEISKRSFPPCARSLFDTLRKTHHLKHEGRQQLRLFLKGCGMTMEDQLILWRGEFGKIMEDSKLKEHVYNIRHTYGAEGSRKSYTPGPCGRIISMPPPSSGCVHGCPFRHSSIPALKTQLKQYGLNEESFMSIKTLVEQHHYQLACVEFFKQSHPENQGEGVGNHPNTYFSLSRQNILEKQADSGPTSTAPSALPAI
eukprot:GHVL01040143.1.p1 GENE.GHVL01040143.1~~GHVL01040143.1.p1  ORF type:complete len:490 (-),score=61.25 GHVL01040143.1:287-1756(-)